jgi:hypothetical protein
VCDKFAFTLYATFGFWIIMRWFARIRKNVSGWQLWLISSNRSARASVVCIMGECARGLGF